MFACWSADQCISRILVCNGKEDCVDGADEDISLCKSAQKPVGVTSATNVSTTVTYIASTEVPKRSTIDMSIVMSILEEIRANSTLDWPTKLSAVVVPVTENATQSATPSTTLAPSTTTPELVKPAVFRLGDLSLHKMESTGSSGPVFDEFTEQGTHATITFPQMLEPAHVNHFQAGFPMPTTVMPVESPTADETVLFAPSTTSQPIGTDLENWSSESQTAEMNVHKNQPAPEGSINGWWLVDQYPRTEGCKWGFLVWTNTISDQCRPQNVRLVNLPHNEISVIWNAPIWTSTWDLVAYNVGCEIENTEAGHKIRKKKSPLLSPLVHEYLFHHILPDDSLKITVTGEYTYIRQFLLKNSVWNKTIAFLIFHAATYRDREQKTYESASEPVYRHQTISSVMNNGKDGLIISSAKQGNNYPGKMGFEDTMGLSVGGALACLMMLLLGLYLFKRKKTNLSHLQGTNVRALRMRKVDR
jgi:hypothetical protein